MASFLAPDDVQHWLENTKLSVSSVDGGLESLALGKVFGVLRPKYDVSTWTTTALTPALVVQLVAMLVAASTYRRQYSEDLTETPAWPVWLETTVENTLRDILNGSVELDATAVAVTDTGLSDPTFWPTDASSEDDPAKFSMAQEF